MGAAIKYTLPPISRFFVPMPEAWLRTKLKYKLKVGSGYLIKEKERGPKIFKDLTMHAIRGLWLTSLRPGEIREKYGLAKTPVLCFTPERVEGEVVVRPDELDRARDIVSSYFFGVPMRSVVFVDCFRKLVFANGFEKAMNFLKEIAGLCPRNNSNLLVQIDPTEFSKRQLAAIKARRVLRIFRHKERERR